MRITNILLLAAPIVASAAELPGRYYRLLEAWLPQVEARLNAEPQASLQTLEARAGWRHFPSAILAAAVLYAKQGRAPTRLALAERLGDLLAAESEKGNYESRLDSHRDTYMWLEAYRLLEADLPEPRRSRWRRELEKAVGALAAESALRVDFPWYNSPYIRTSPNHFSLWASTTYLAGRVFGNKEWEALGARILHRFAAEEQAPDGFWGEHSRNGPTTGYDYLTLTAVALYYEHSRDPAALEALRRSTNFHQHFTYPDGTPVEVINDRNRYWAVSPWGSFGFSHFPDGRGYAEFLSGFFREASLSLENLGRIAQDALYFRDGEVVAAPQRQPRYAWRMSLPAGIRKTGPWVTALSGIIDTQATDSQFYLDRQGHLSVFHEKLGLLITGANSKRQPELATFRERHIGQLFHLPMSSRLQMSDDRDRLSLAYHTFFTDLVIPPPSNQQLSFRFSITGKGRPPEQAFLTLQLCLKAGELLEIASGRRTLSEDRLDLDAAALGGWMRHRGWTRRFDGAAQLAWPVYPFNPYANGPETGLARAVGALSIPLALKGGRGLRPGEQEMAFTLEAH